MPQAAWRPPKQRPRAPPNLSPLTPPWHKNPRKQPAHQQQPEPAVWRPVTVGEWQNTYPSAGFGRPKRLPGPG
eukprot:6998268-Prymnesium_polylepis.1